MADVDATRAVLYGAKSTKDERGSIPTQLADGRELAERNGWEVVAEYSDEDASAYKGNRGDGLAQAKAHTASINGVLIVQHSDRLARGDGVAADHLVEIVLWLRKQGATITSVQDPQTFDGMGLVYAAMMGDRNHEDSKRKGASVRSGLQRRRAKGMHNGGPRKYGYEHVRDEYGRTVAHEPIRPLPHEAAIVARIFSEYVAGVSQRSIGRALTAEGIPTARGVDWHQGTIAKYLRDPWYAGFVSSPDGELISARHEAIVSLDLWERARALREATARTSGKGRGRLPNASHLFVKGMLRCGLCGGAMVPRSDSQWEPSYYCYQRVRMGREACAQTPVKRETIDTAVMNYFMGAGLDVEATRRDIEAGAERAVSEIRELRSQAQRDEHKAAERLARVKRDYLDGRLDADDWQAFRAELTAEQEAACAKLERLQAQEASVIEDARESAEGDTLRYLAVIREAVIGTVRNAQGVDAVRAALLQLFEGFTLRRAGDGYNPDRVSTSLMMDDGYVLQPRVRTDRIIGYGPVGITPKHGRVGLAAPSRAKNNDSNAFAFASFFAPIPVAA